MRFDPVLVEDLYRAAFSHREESEEQTTIGESQILGMLSNRRQDYKGGLWSLAEAYPQFLTTAPERATRVLISVLADYVSQRHAPSSGEVTEEPFTFLGREARVRADYSVSWDATDVYRHEEPVRMLDAFCTYVGGLAKQEEGSDLLAELVDVVAQENPLAALWRRPLVLGVETPKTLGMAVRSLLWAVPILAGFDTHAAAGELLKVIYTDLAVSEREAIERAILSIPEAYPGRPHGAERVRNQLLGCLARLAMVTDEAKDLISRLAEEDNIPPNEPPVRMSGFVGKPYGEIEWLAEQGVPVDEDANARIRELEKPVREFIGKHRNSDLTADLISAVFPAIVALWEGLKNTGGVHPEQRTHGWDTLAEGAKVVASTDELVSVDGIAADEVSKILLEASKEEVPAPNSERDHRFDKSPSWGTPAPRVWSADGLPMLARFPPCATAEVLQAIEKLSRDPVPAVRYQVAGRLTNLYRTALDLMWQIIERLCWEERSSSVVHFLLNTTLSSLAGAHPDRVTALTSDVFQRFSGAENAKNLRASCVQVFVGL